MLINHDESLFVVINMQEGLLPDECGQVFSENSYAAKGGKLVQRPVGRDP
jgi:hypothetical protein